MKKITFDSGLRNPLDPNLYERFMHAANKFTELEAELVSEAKAEENEATSVLKIMKRFDQKAKALLNDVFGPGNDFDHMLAGVNLMAVADNGERVITNLIDALTPILEQGAKDCAASFMRKGEK